MSLHVSIDFGTSSTCTVVSVGGGEPHVVVIDGQPLVPSAVFAAPDGTLFVGHEAERQAAVDPSRFEPHPKRRIDEGELLLGSTVMKVGDVVRSVLQRAVGEARRYAGGAVVDLLVLTHPADWGAVRATELRNAAVGLAKELVLVPEPVAAAVFHSAGYGLPDGGALAVLDLGGGTVDASVVAKQGRAFQVLATRGEPNFGGADIDQALLEHIGRTVSGTDPQAWRQLVEGREMADRRRRRVLRQDVRGAKETLSRHTYTDVPMPPPFSDAHVTRADLEALIAEPLGKAADLVPTVLREGGVSRQRLAGVFLVGGSSRIPMVSRLIHERTGVVPTTLDQPETVVARGALRAVRLDPERSGGLAPSGGWSGGRQRTVRNYPVGAPPSGGHPAPVAGPGTTSGDSLSRASTIVIGGSDQTRPVSTQVRRGRGRRPKAVWMAAVAAAVVVAAGVARRSPSRRNRHRRSRSTANAGWRCTSTSSTTPPTGTRPAATRGTGRRSFHRRPVRAASSCSRASSATTPRRAGPGRCRRSGRCTRTASTRVRSSPAWRRTPVSPAATWSTTGSTCRIRRWSGTSSTKSSTGSASGASGPRRAGSRCSQPVPTSSVPSWSAETIPAAPSRFSK